MIPVRALYKSALFIAALAATAIAFAQAPIALTESGPISGVAEGGLKIYKGIPFAAPPVGEGYVLPRSSYEAFASGQQNDVPLLLGSNAEEARSLTDVSKVTAAGFESDLEHSFGQLPPTLIAAYPHATDEEARTARLDLERDLRFGWDMWAWARLQSTTGHSPVFYYSFRQQPPFPAGSVYAGWGASHFAELWYVFDHLNQEPWQWTATDRKVADEMSTYWTNFARSGDPAGKGLPSWAAFTKDHDNVLYIGPSTKIGPVANLKSLKVFDEVYSSVRGKPFGTP